MTRSTHAARSRPLDLEENLPFQRRMWAVQRVGWLAIVLVLLLAALGVLGPGRFSRRIIREAAMTLEYSRVGRMHSAQQVRLLLSSSAGPHRLRIGRELAGALNLERIEPQPAAASSDSIALVFSFAGPAAEILLHARPTRMGWARGIVQVDDGPSFTLAQLVLP